MKYFKKISIKLKLKILRCLIKRKNISFNKSLIRMHYIQQLKILNKYDTNKLSKFSYKKLKKIFIKEFPNEYIHNPKNS